MKFHTKLIIAFLSISISIIFIFTFIQFTNSSRYILTLEQKNLTEKSLIIKKQMDNYLDQVENLVLNIATNKEVLDFLEKDEYSNPESINALFDKIKQISPEEYSAIFITDSNGICRSSTDRRFIGTDYSFRSYYQELLNRNKKLYLSDYSIGLRSKIPGIFLAVPLESENNELLGILILKIEGLYIQNMIDELNTLDEPAPFIADNHSNIRLLKPVVYPDLNPEIFIINKESIIIMHPDPDRLFHSIMPLSHEVSLKIRERQQFLDKKIESLDEPVLAELHKKTLISHQPTAVVYRNEQEENWEVLALAPLENNDWCVGVALSYNQFRLLSRELLITMISISILILLLVIAAALKMTKLMMKPMDYLLTIMNEVMKKNWAVRLTISGRDEFSFLGQRFNELLSIIENYSKNMEQQIQQRTKEVIDLQKENTRLRIIEERDRLFRDLHDSLGARLTNINICNNVAQTGLEQDSILVKEMLGRIDANCEQAIEDMKDIISREDTSLLHENIFGENMINRLKNRLSPKKITLVTYLPPEEVLLKWNKDYAHEIRGIIDELISNVLKHSEADNVIIRIEQKKSNWEIYFSDNGKGIIEKEMNRSYGLGNIEKRILRLKGSFNLKSEPGIGTSYTIVTPLKPTVEKVEDGKD